LWSDQTTGGDFGAAGCAGFFFLNVVFGTVCGAGATRRPDIHALQTRVTRTRVHVLHGPPWGSDKRAAERSERMGIRLAHAKNIFFLRLGLAGMCM
jgi:hypothetical protein